MYIYLIGENTGPQKIGITGDLKARLSTIQTGNPNKLYLHHSVEFDDNKCALVERIIHNTLNRYHVKGEWYNISIDDGKAELDFALIRYEDDELLKYR